MLTPRSVLGSTAGVHRLLQAYSPACRLHLSSKPGAKPLAVSFLWLTFFSYATFTSAGEPLIGEQVRGGQLLHRQTRILSRVRTERPEWVAMISKDPAGECTPLQDPCWLPRPTRDQNPRSTELAIIAAAFTFNS